MFDWLFQPFPLERGFSRKMKSAAWGGLVVFIALFLLQPFGAGAGFEDVGEFAATCFRYGLITFFTALLHGALSFLFEKKTDESEWVVWKTILSTLILILMIGIANWIYAGYTFGMPMNFYTFWTWIYMTFIVGLIPTLVGYFLYLKNLVSKYSAGANDLNQEIQEISAIDNSSPIFLKGENQNEELNLKTSQLLYLEAANNYVEVVFEKEGEEKKLIRSTLKKMESQLAEHDQFFRCHKTFIVNLNQVEKISGNAQGYKLHLKTGGKLIPVSRSLNKEISSRFKT